MNRLRRVWVKNDTHRLARMKAGKEGKLLHEVYEEAMKELLDKETRKLRRYDENFKFF